MNDEWLSNPIHEDSPVVQPYTGSPYDPYDGDANPEFGPPCPECKAEMDWEDCHACGAEGYLENEVDDYSDRTVIEKCIVCMGAGGFWYCGNCGHTLTEAELKQASELHQREE